MSERQIVIGCITSTKYLQQIKDEWNSQYIESTAAKMLCDWCFEYFNKYGKSPMRDIENILLKKVKRKKIKKALAEEIETEILQDLNNEYENQTTDLDVLLLETREYFIQRQIEIHQEKVTVLLEKGQIVEARQLQDTFKFKIGGENVGIDLADKSTDDRIDEAFDSNTQIVVKFTGALGKFLNDEMVKGAFVSFLAPEKAGKTFLLLEILILAYEQGKKVVFFQAGDMTEGQQLIRMGIYLTQKSNKEKFCGKQYIPVVDCVKNQNDTCNRRIRASKFGIFPEKTEKEIREEVTYEELVEAKLNNKFYRNCYNCINWQNNPWGAVWLEEFDNGPNPLTATEAKQARRKFFANNNMVRLITYANGELTIDKMNNDLDSLKLKGFEPELILADYADLIVGQKTNEMRHSIDYIWKSLRGMSQKRNALTISPTQADAKSYEQDLLTRSNFSEAKSKLAHATAIYGLNHDTKGRERKLGIIRINKIVVREDSFHQTDQVYVLQKLGIGRPKLGSFF